MAKKRLGYVELAWTCPSCQAENAGTARTCAQCGAAMPQGQAFHLPGQQKLDTTAETAARVAAGPDVLCPYCGTRNPGNAPQCSQCGAPLGDATAREAGQVVGAYQAGPGKPRICPACGAENAADAKQCSQCGASLVTSARPRPRPQPAAPATPKKSWTWAVLLFFAVMLGLFGLMISLQRPKQEIRADIQSVLWTHTVEVEQQVTVDREAWHDELPVGATATNCVEKVRRTLDEPAPGAIERCGTPYVVDTGTGKGQVQQDCVYDVMERWCRYQAQEWRADTPIVARGSDLQPYWPTVSLGSQQREVGRKVAYRVQFDDDGRVYTYYTNDLTSFQRFAPGSRWWITTNALGTVMAVRPAD